MDADPAPIPAPIPAPPPPPASAPAPPLAPPTDPVPIQRAQLSSSWPGVLGAISIVFGVLGILGGLMAVLSPFFFYWVKKFGGPEAEPTFAVADKWMWWTLLSSAVAVLLAIVLLVGGVRLVRHQPRSRPLLLTWSGVKIAWSAIATGVGAIVQKEMHAATPATPGMPPVVMDVVVIVSLLLGFIMVTALPIFMLVWLTRPRVKTEVSSWETPTAPAA